MAAAKQKRKTQGQKKNGATNATGLLRRPLLISVGALALAEEQASSLFDSFVKRGEKTRKAGEKYVKKLLDNDTEARPKPKKSKKEPERREDWVQRALHWLNIPTRHDIEQLNKKVDALAKKVA